LLGSAGCFSSGPGVWSTVPLTLANRRKARAADATSGLALDDGETQCARRRAACTINRGERGLVAARFECLALDASAEGNLVQPRVRRAGQRCDRSWPSAARLVVEPVAVRAATATDSPAGRVGQERGLHGGGLVEPEGEDGALFVTLGRG